MVGGQREQRLGGKAGWGGRNSCSVTCRWGESPYGRSCEPRQEELALSPEGCGSHWRVKRGEPWVSCVEEECVQEELGLYVQGR